MAVTVPYAPLVYSGASVIVPIPVTWPFIDPTHLQVTATSASVSPAVLTLNVNYTVTQTPTGGTITPLAAIATGTTWTIRRVTPKLQPSVLRTGGRFPPETVEGMSDRAALIEQETPVFAAYTPLAPVILSADGLRLESGNTVGSGDLLLRANLAASPAGAGSNGAELVAVQRGTSARLLSDVLLEQDITPEDYGAVGDGVTNDYVAINAALVAASTAVNRTVRFTKAVYAFGTKLVWPVGVRGVGRGNSFTAYNGYSASTGSKLLWIGATGGGSIAVEFKYHNYGGAGWDGLMLDSNAKADVGMLIDGCTGLDFGTVTSINSRVADMKWVATLSAVGTFATTNSWNTYRNLFLGSDVATGCSLYVGGDLAAGNSCHNTVHNLKISHGGGVHAMILANCDNCTFIDTFIFRNPGGTGYGVKVEPDSIFPIANVFVSLQAGAGGWYQPNTVIESPATIYEYKTDNGQPWPVINGTQLYFSNNFNGFMTSQLPGTVGAAGQPAFQNSWVAFGGSEQAPRYWKDRLGFVHLEGSTKNGTSMSTTVFTLPVGYRPTALLTFPVNSNGAFGTVNIASTGVVTAVVGSTTHFSLSGVSFRADYLQT